MVAQHPGQLSTDGVTSADQEPEVSARLPAAERRVQLLRVARQVLARQGFYQTTMAEIADSAGVTKPVLYQHFQSKRDLYTAVLVDVGTRLRTAVVDAAEAAAVDGPRMQANAGFRAYVRFVEEDREGFRLLFSGTSRQDREWSSITREVEHSIAQGIADLIDVPELGHIQRQALAHGVMGMAEGMMRYWQSGRAGDLARDDLIDDLIALAWGGLRGLRA